MGSWGRIYIIAFLLLVAGALYLGMRAVAREQEERRRMPYLIRRGMRGVAGVAISTSSAFLLVVAILLNSPPLFYMSTALLATIGMSRLQAFLSIRGLHFERFVPEKASVGELVTVELTLYADRRIRRPLVTLIDMLPAKMAAAERSSSLPVAPAFDVPIRTQYRFRPMRRGRFRWRSVRVYGTDALGLVTVTRDYDLELAELLVVPTPLPLELDMPGATGFGIAEAESGQSRGSGIEPRGLREYTSGDSIRYIHWPAVARTGRLLVKEFETGSHSMVAFVLQRTKGTDIGEGANSTLEHMCSHVAYLSDRMLRNGSSVVLPTIEANARHTASPHERAQEILISLAGIENDSAETIGAELLRAGGALPYGSHIYVFVGIADDELPGAVRQLVSSGMRVTTLVYDANSYTTNTRGVETAASSQFIDTLGASGALVVQVPFTKV